MVLVGLCVLGLLLGMVQNNARSAHKVDRFATVIRSLINPVSAPLSGATRAASDFCSGIASARHLAAENRHLKALLVPLAMYSDTINAKDQEIDRYRAMLKFGPLPGKKRVPASVIGFSINENRLTLNVGSNQGLSLGCAVESSEGLVGTVEEVEANTSQVLMLTSAGLQMTSNGKTQLIGAVDISRSPPSGGLVRGETASTLTMTFLDPKAPVQIGDIVQTSGYSDKIPGQILLGKVIQIEPNEEFGTLKARIDPAVSPAKLDVVFVLV